MNVGTLINDLTIFVLAILLGFEVISRVRPHCTHR